MAGCSFSAISLAEIKKSVIFAAILKKKDLLSQHGVDSSVG